MNLSLKIKSLVLLACLFFSADAVVNYKLLWLKNIQQRSGYKTRQEVTIGSLFSLGSDENPAATAANNEIISHSRWVDKVRIFSHITVPLSSVQNSKNSSKNEQPQKAKKRRGRITNGICLLITPPQVQLTPLVHFSSTTFGLFYQQYILSAGYYELSLRGPPACVIA